MPGIPAVRILRLMAAILLLLPPLGACDTATVYQPFDADAMTGRSALVLQPTYVKPVSEALHSRIIAGVEARLLKFPHLGRVLSRKEATRRMADDRKLRREYDLFSDTLTVVGVSDQEGSAKLGKSFGVELLLAAQLFYMPCPQCELGSQLGLVTNLVEADSGKLLWRGHFLAAVSGDDPQERAAIAEELVDKFFVAFDEDLRPKWHRLRFINLSRAGFG